jgi:hypothetical protein
LLAIPAGVLRDLLRTDLERSGFKVVTGVRSADADVVVTEGGGRRGRRLTVRLGAEIEVYGPDGTWWFPTTELSRLGDVLHAELSRGEEAA